MSKSSARQLFWGVDIGGTKMGVCIGDASGRRVAHATFRTDHTQRPAEIIDRALHLLRQLSRQHGVQPCGLGFACPGPMSSRQGRFLDPPNMPLWHDFELLKHVRRAVSMPVAMINDANACALAEWRWGAAVGAQTAIFVTMSTGMGAGLIIQGRLLEGPDHLAGEIGHLRLDPDGPVGFGKRGSVEGYLSGPGMTQLARAEAIRARQIGEPTRLWPQRTPLSELHPQPKRICQLAAAGDPAARRAIARSADALGRLAALLTDVLNPEVLVLGTMGSAWPKLFIPPARRVLRAEAIGRAARRLKIVPSGLGRRRGDLSAIACACHAAGV